MYDDDESVRLVIWDIAGQSQFQSLRRRYYEGCSGLILVYSVVDREAFDNCTKWLVEAKGYMDEFPALIIVGNKIDLRSYHPKEEVISYEEGLEFTKTFSEKLNTNAIFIETSALTGENIDRAFEKLTRMMINPEDRQTITTMHEVHMGEVERPPASESGVVQASTPSEETSVSSDETVAVAPAVEELIIPQEDEVAITMTKLIELRAKLKKAEEEFRDYSLEVESKLLNLRNTVHVKKIMYEHLRQQLTQTRQEWSDAYDEHVELDQKKKQEVENKLDHIENIRKQIDRIERSVRQQVRDLELDKRPD
jgi:small GTP-binding protein